MHKVPFETCDTGIKVNSCCPGSVIKSQSNEEVAFYVFITLWVHVFLNTTYSVELMLYIDLLLL